MLLGLLGVTPVSVIGCLAVRLIFYRCWPSLAWHIHWIFYSHSFLLLDSLLIIDDPATNPRSWMLMSPCLICESFRLFGLGIIMNATNLVVEQRRGQEQDEDKKEHCVSIAANRTVKIISLFIVVLGLVGLVLWCGVLDYLEKLLWSVILKSPPRFK
ncbi:hypothetical protein NEHOM01_2399 [Nematocida homosporus]|uniref:uncharacterized protein n=1 Tax=Nematocida homosporus TaxID=1912981 RepID=UPI00221EA019|nr:uncharacterized protein NEHOM01_2399 [Nematocida homosporus]KAI5187835.1 hypothetical protein NEHOM01_2399 [Nematocida homosporus]